MDRKRGIRVWRGVGRRIAGAAWLLGLAWVAFSLGAAAARGEDSGFEVLSRQEAGDLGPACFHFFAHRDAIHVRHESAERSCCLQLAPRVSLSGAELRIIEGDAGGPCDCQDVGWNLDVEIRGLPARVYDVYLLDDREEILATARLTVPETETLLFVRGDANADGAVDVSDPIFVLSHLFLGAAGPACLDSADSNDDGSLDISDAVHLLSYLFSGGEEPPPPFPGAGEDPTEDSYRCGLENEVVASDFVRGTGDLDGNFSVDLSDCVYCLQIMQLEGPWAHFSCPDALDLDDDGVLTLSDCMFLCWWPWDPLAEGAGLGAPGPDRTPDTLGCACGGLH